MEKAIADLVTRDTGGHQLTTHTPSTYWCAAVMGLPKTQWVVPFPLSRLREQTCSTVRYTRCQRNERRRSRAIPININLYKSIMAAEVLVSTMSTHGCSAAVGTARSAEEPRTIRSSVSDKTEVARGGTQVKKSATWADL